MNQVSGHLAESVVTYIKFIRAAESVIRRVNLPLLDENLTTSQFGVLEALLHHGPMSQKDLSAKILKSCGNISIVVDNLEKRNLVVRTRGAVQDRRIVVVSLTAEGRELVESVLPAVVERIEEEMGILSREQLRELGDMCRLLGLRTSGRV